MADRCPPQITIVQPVATATHVVPGSTVVECGRCGQACYLSAEGKLMSEARGNPYWCVPCVAPRLAAARRDGREVGFEVPPLPDGYTPPGGPRLRPEKRN